MCRTLGLTSEQTDAAVVLRPLPPLRRLGRRATVGELGVLDTMSTAPLGLAVDRPTVREVLAAVDGRLRAASAHRSASRTAPPTASWANGSASPAPPR